VRRGRAREPARYWREHPTEGSVPSL